MRSFFLVGVAAVITNVEGGEELLRWRNNEIEVCTISHYINL